jgi:chemotaxis protein methyltransferase CheR
MGEKDVGGLVLRMRRGDPALTDAVVDALTTNETSWFRDTHPFDAFTQHLLPDVAKSSVSKQLTIWSAACSSGQEAYSLAMLLLDWLPGHPGYTARIVGTDISAKMVERARSARFSQLEVNRGLRAPYLVKYFDQNGRDWVLRQPLRDMCRFERGNLATPPVGVPTCDIVFLRNVLIYFDLDTKRTVLTHVRKVLRPGGFLVLGGAESTLNLDDAFQRMELGRAVVFRHTGGAA